VVLKVTLEQLEQYPHRICILAALLVLLLVGQLSQVIQELPQVDAMLFLELHAINWVQCPRSSEAF
jgi:hypothetical protein